MNGDMFAYQSNDETLDPEDWEAFRSLAHRMVDDAISYIATLRDRPVWQPMPETVSESFDEPCPFEGIGEEAAYQAFLKRVLPYPNGNIHPRFFGWVQGNGTPLGMMADMLAAAMNPHMAGFNQAPALVERQLIKWLSGLMGMPQDTSGVLVTGGSTANMLGLAVARYAKVGYDVRTKGLQNDHPMLVFYGSTETHGWAQKAAEFLGFGSEAYRRIRTSEDYSIDLDALQMAIREDRKSGNRPFCVIGTAGTVNTGSTDDLEALERLCREQDMWFHIDGAFGALVRFSERLRPIVKGIKRADSVAFDFHKWGYLPFECACILVRDAEMHRAAFATSPVYLATASRGVIAGGLPYADRGIDLTRGFKALKAWLSFKAHGVNRLARLIEQNVSQARYLEARVSTHPDLEILAPVPLNIVCFRYKPSSKNLSDTRLNEINEEILFRIQEAGVAVPSSTVLGGRYALRACITNHRSRRDDLDALLEAVIGIGADVTDGIE